MRCLHSSPNPDHSSSQMPCRPSQDIHTLKCKGLKENTADSPWIPCTQLPLIKRDILRPAGQILTAEVRKQQDCTSGQPATFYLQCSTPCSSSLSSHRICPYQPCSLRVLGSVPPVRIGSFFPSDVYLAPGAADMQSAPKFAVIAIKHPEEFDEWYTVRFGEG